MATRNKSWKACGVFCFKNVIYYGGVLLSYTWGRTDKPMKIPIKNEKERQTYYGALDDQTKEFIVQEYKNGNTKNGNTENTIEFVKYLKDPRLRKRLAIFWDRASYHNSQEFRELLKLINQEKPEDKWWINCLKFAPNTPEQNPVEDIWLQTKNFIIAFYHLCSSFKIVKWLFKFFADGQIFDFPKTFSVWNFATTIHRIAIVILFLCCPQSHHFLGWG